MEEVVVIIDPSEHADYTAHYVNAFHRGWGIRSALLYPQQVGRVRAAEANAVIAPAGVASRIRVDLSDLASVAKALVARYEVIGVVPQAEAQVYAAADLAERVGVDWVPLSTVSLFRDKFRLKELLRTTPGGPRVNASTRVRTTDDVLGFVREHGLTRFVLKPNDGMGNSRVVFFDVTRTSASDIDAYMGACGGGATVVEEFICGEEYCLNGQVDDRGVVQSLSLQRLGYISANGRTNLAGSMSMVPHSTSQFAMAEEYACQILGIAGLRKSPFHMDLKIDDRGPCMIEVGARMGGAGIPYDTALAHDNRLDMFARAAQFYANLPGDSWEPDWDLYNSSSIRTVFGAASARERVRRLRGIEVVEAMPEFAYWVVKPKLGQGVRPTVDLMTSPWQATLRAPDAGGLDAAEAITRNAIEWNGSAPVATRILDAGRAAGSWVGRRIPTVAALFSQSPHPLPRSQYQ